MFRLLRLIRTSIGKKLLMSLSGLVLILFIIGHAVGNLTIFVSANALNTYAHWLQENPLLWLIRFGMIAILMIHIALAVVVSRENRRSRSCDYGHDTLWLRRVKHPFMMWSGAILLLFLLFHIGHLTLGIGGERYMARLDHQGYVDVYARVVLSFTNPWLTTLYLIAMAALGLHLYHAIRSVFQTLGFYHDNYFGFFHTLALLLTLFTVIGFILILLTALLGGFELATEIDHAGT
ncbi:succinate:quinone oxidoreductase [Ectothiorhodospiraceae bacterium BW-2]|nr:succinate:quinone oxidoreductase [Ectothiorhodospiraceae bacterium BW-2]